MPFWVKLLILGFGLLFLGVGIGVGVFSTRAAQAEIARVEALAPIAATELEQRATGEAVIVEGTVSERNRALFRDFVAYRVEEYRGEDSEGRDDWQLLRTETPRLLIDAAGLVQVGNQDYELGGLLIEWQESEELVWGGLSGGGTKRYAALIAGLPVVALGTIEQGAEGNQLRAQMLFAGTRADYLQSQRNAITTSLILGPIFGLLGLLIVGFTLWDMRRTRR